MNTIFSAGAYRLLSVAACLAVILSFNSCDNGDPEPVNEEEVITTFQITLAPSLGGDPVILKFFDSDGEQGSIEPVITVSRPLSASTLYTAIIELRNETTNPAVNVTEEVAEEGDDHLFCFESSNSNLDIEYEDEDSNGFPIGLVSSWRTGSAGETSVTVALRHQAGTKPVNVLALERQTWR
jgi:hypothetical protein